MALVWTPLVNSLKNIKDDLSFLIAPFVQKNALELLLQDTNLGKKTAVITRWNAEDILAGVSDLSVYPFLKDLGIPLYINQNIHLKMLIYSSNKAFVGSGNITDRGLGISKNSNIEVGLFSQIDFDDWKQVFSIIENSILVNDKMYQKAVEYREKYKKTPPPIPKFIIDESNVITQSQQKAFSLNVLPASKTPRELYQNRKNCLDAEWDIRTQSPYLHDMLIYNLSPAMGEEEFMYTLKENFLATAFIKKLVLYIQENAPLNFGKITSWVHEQCSDVPLPYRYEIKMHIAILYDWLAFFVPEITWDIPGKKSQVMYWNQK